MQYPNLSEEEFKALFEILGGVADAESRDQEWEGYVISSYTYHKAEKLFNTLKERGIIK